MKLLSQDLLTVIDCLPSSTSQAVVAQCRHHIESQADSLDAIVRTCQDSAVHPALSASKASKLLFGSRAITSDDGEYTQAQQRPW